MKIEREQTMVLIVDYQEKLVPVMYKKEKLLENSCILLRGLRELGIPMCITQQYTNGLGMTVEQISEAAGEKDYVDKISFSAADCVKQELAGKKFVIICGIEAHICVLQTLIDLKEQGYVPVLVTDCISSRKKKDKDMAILRAASEGAVITTYESLLFELLQRAGSDESKRIQKLIK